MRILLFGSVLALTFGSQAVAQTYCNSSPITIPVGPGTATPYPSVLTVTGATTLSSVSVVVNGLSHTFPADIDMLLVAPTGQAMVVQSDAGGGTDVSSVSYVLSDASGVTIPEPIGGGSYLPTDNGAGDTFAGAPAGPYAEPQPAGTATLNGVFGGIDPNGNWQLYVVDDAAGDAGSISGGWCLRVNIQPPKLRIAEFRVRGPNGANDEYIEVENVGVASTTVNAFDGSSGFAIAASDGAPRCVIPNGTVIPAGGHYLCVNSVGYSLASYASGVGTTATGDATYTTDIADNAGIALFGVSGAGNFTLANRIDAVGSTSEANALYKEGAGYPALTPFSIDYAFYRDTCGKGGSITNIGPCTRHGIPADTENNAKDFVFVDSNGTSAGAGQRLGAAGPQNLSAPIMSSTVSIPSQPLDSCALKSSPPNAVRDFTSDPANNSTFGTLDLRRTFTNSTGAPLTRLRFRVIDLTTFPAPSGIADLRPRTSTSVVVTVDRPPCGTGSNNITVQGTTLEQPPSQPNGGGFNSSMSVNLGSPLAVGQSVDVRFLLGIQQTGSYKFAVIPEALPRGGKTEWYMVGCTDGCPADADYIFADSFNF